MKHKVCLRCNKPKRFAQFSLNEQSPDGLSTICIQCFQNKNSVNRELKKKAKEANKKAYRRAYNKAYELAKEFRTPSWLSVEQKTEIKEIYRKAQNLTLTTGISHHVDHIIPVNGENVSGLHVPWNLQILTSKENIKKSNKLVEN